MPPQPTPTMTDPAATAAQRPYILQPAVREPGCIEKIDYQASLFDGILDELRLEAMRRALATRNQPNQDLQPMAPILDRMKDKDREVYLELANIDFRELWAPEGEFDDRADAYALAQALRGYAFESRNIAVIALD